MRALILLLMTVAGLWLAPAWADHRHDDDRRAPFADQRRDSPRFMPQQPRQLQRDPREYQSRDTRDYPQRDPREYQQQYSQQYQRQPQSGFMPRGEPQYARPNDFSPGDAARRAQEMNGGGRILSVDPNGPGYRVKVLKEGEVRVIAVPGG